LNSGDADRNSGAVRVWKSFDWAAMNRLYNKGLIHAPVTKAKSVWLTREGLKKAEFLFQKFFRKKITRRNRRYHERPPPIYLLPDIAWSAASLILPRPRGNW